MFDEDAQSATTTNRCPECDGRVTTSTAETICEDCGLVIDEQRIDPGPEWRSFDTDNRKRTGAPLTVARHDRGLSTKIGKDGTDVNGNTPSGRKRRQFGRLRREQKRGKWQPKAERNLSHGLSEVRRLTSVWSRALEPQTTVSVRKTWTNGWNTPSTTKRLNELSAR